MKQICWKKFTTIKYIFIGTFFLSLNCFSQMSLDEQKSDFSAMIQLLNSTWANNSIHAQKSGINLSQRAKKAYLELVKPPVLSDSKFAVFITKFLNSLSDGHINADLSTLSEFDYSQSQFSFQEAEEGLVLVSCQFGCEKLQLPVLVKKIDGETTESWLKKRLVFSLGSTDFGKRYNLIRSLSFRAEIRGLTDLAKVLTVQNSAGVLKKIIFAWSKSAFVNNATSCVNSDIVNQTLILKISSFLCEDPEFPSQYDTKGLQKFRRELVSSLSKGIYTKVLIDLRGNTGGLPQPAKDVIGYFIEEPIYWFGVRNLQNPYSDSIVPEFAQPIKNPDALVELKSMPLWFLTDASCFSQCSIFVIAAKLAGRAKIIGRAIDPGAGSGMNPRWMAPSGRWTLSVPPWIVLAEDGQFIEGYPLELDLETKPTLQKFKLHKDATLMDALESI